MSFRLVKKPKKGLQMHYIAVKRAVRVKGLVLWFFHILKTAH